jgi:tetratricopeptide (TPR) repeat protein
MGSLFLDNNGNLLFKNNSTTSLASAYLDWADKAMANVNNLAIITDLERTYQSGDRTTVFLEKYIRALRDADKDSDAIMEEYIGKMTIDSLKTDKIILFVKEQGLSLSSSAYKAVQSLNSSKKIDSIWYLMPLSKRIKINNRTTSQTYNEAVRHKDKMLIYQLSSFTQNIYGSNYRKGEFFSQAQRVSFHSAINDTSGFVQRADMFASSIMRIPNDSLKAWNTQEREEIFSNREQEKRFRPVSSTYADQLNTMAWQCYLMINEARYLEKALKWSERSIAIFNDIPISTSSENAAYLDTYAHLLYKLKRYDEAVEWQTKAVEAQKAAHVKSDGFEQEREKMKSRKL